MASTSECKHEFVLVVRHGRDPVLPSAQLSPRDAWRAYDGLAAQDARPDIWQSISRLHSMLTKDLPTVGTGLDVIAIHVSDRDDPRVVTAGQLLARVCGTPQIDDSSVLLGPNGGIGPYWQATAATALETAWTTVEDELRDENQPGNAVVLVGNQPAIDWFLEGKVDAPVAVAAGEIVCLVRAAGTKGRHGGFLAGLRHGHVRWKKSDWHLWWSITPSASTRTEAIRAKVQSKMTVLGVLAGFTVAVIATVLVDLPTPPENRWWSLGAVACFALAAVLFTGALFAYDQLMMPSRWWAARRPISRRARERTFDPLATTVTARPPAADSSVIHQESLRIWTWVGLGVVLAGVGVGLLAVSATWEQGGTALAAVIAGLAVIAAVAALWWWRAAPALGSED